MEPNAKTHDEATAYHEAGHAVVALALGRPVASVSIRPSQQRAGVCEFGKAVFRPSEDWLEREMLIALAGIAAEARHGEAYDWQAGANDYRYAEHLARERAGDDVRRAEKLLRRALAKTEHLLNKEGCWRAVERLVKELMRDGEVSGRSAQHIYEACQREAD